MLEFLVRARAAGVPCCAPCPPADKGDKASASSFTYAQQGTPPARFDAPSRFYVKGTQHWFRPRASGVRFPEVKEEGRRFFGPGDMEGIGYPMTVARRCCRYTSDMQLASKGR